jgi:hypothetical protein
MNLRKIWMTTLIALVAAATQAEAAGNPHTRQCWDDEFSAVQTVPNDKGYETWAYAGRCDATVYVDSGDIDFTIDIREDNDGKAPPHVMWDQGSFGPTGTAHGSSTTNEETYTWAGAHGRARLNVKACGTSNAGVCHGHWWLCCSAGGF